MPGIRPFLRPLLLAALTFGALACGGGGDGEPEVELPALTSFDEQLGLRLAGISTTAAEVRGLELNEDIEQGTLSQEELADYYRRAATDASLQEDTDIQAYNTAYRLLHMMGPDDDLLKLSGESGAEGILGFYTFEGEQLVLVADSPEALTWDNEATMAHEYVHSFQDKQFNLKKLVGRVEKEQSEKAHTEYGETLDALIEGDATVAEFEYIEKRVGPDGFRQWLASGEGEDAPADDEPDVPLAFGRYGAFPYTYGAAFVRQLLDEGGWDAVNEAYKDPPTTEEQILHPEKYLDGEEAVEVYLADISESLGEGWQQEMDTMFGEFDVYNWLRSTLDNEFQTASAAAGWGGGRLAVYSNPLQEDQSIIQVSLAWDNEQEAREFYAAFSELIRRIDPEPTVLDPTAQMLAWDAPGENGHAWIDQTFFEMVVSMQPDDLERAKTALETPDSIPSSGYILQDQPVVPSTQRVRRIEDTLLRASDLPPGFVQVQTGESDVQFPGFPQGGDQLYALFTDARSPGQGVDSAVVRARGVLPYSVAWSDLAAEDSRLVFDNFAGEFAFGEVRSFSGLPVDGIGQGAIGVRAEVVPPAGGTPQVVNMVVFGRGAILGVVVSFQDVGAQEVDVLRLARVVDDRLTRFQM